MKQSEIENVIRINKYDMDNPEALNKYVGMDSQEMMDCIYELEKQKELVIDQLDKLYVLGNRDSKEVCECLSEWFECGRV